jgi:hypothetical protein
MRPIRFVRSAGVPCVLSVLVAAAVAAVAVIASGCAEQRMEARRDVKIAALAKYPGGAKRSDAVPVTAVDYPGQKKLELLNTGDKPVLSPIVWVNQTFLNRAETIPARGSVTVKYVDLIEQGQGVQDLAANGGSPSTVELQTSDGLFTALGPVRK